MRAVAPARTVDQRLRAAGRPYDLVAGVSCTGDACPGLPDEAEAAGIGPGDLVRGVLLVSPTGESCLAVVPAGTLIDFEALAAVTGRCWEPAGLEAASRRFADCDPGCVPVLGEAYGLRVVVDVAVARMGTVHFEGGRHGCYVRMSGRDFTALQPHALIARIARPAPRVSGAEADAGGTEALLPSVELCGRIERVYDVPRLPEAARPLLAALGAAEEPAPAEAARLVAADTRAAARVLELAASPLLGGGRPADVAAAVAGPLGPGGAVAAALAAVVEELFRVPPGGPLGGRALAREAALAAALAMRIAGEARCEPPPRRGLLVAAALLHDVGLRLLAHLFQPEFHLLNRMAAANPDTPVPELESHLLALGEARHVVQTGHARLGAWLLRAWGAPPALVATAGAHHHPEADVGGDWPYPAIVATAEAVLARAEGREGRRAAFPAVARRLGLADGFLEGLAAAAAALVEPAREGRRSVA